MGLAFTCCGVSISRCRTELDQFDNRLPPNGRVQQDFELAVRAVTCPSLHRHLRIEHVVPTTLYSVDTPRVDHSEPLPGPAEEELGVDKLWARVSSPSLGKVINDHDDGNAAAFTFSS